MKCSTTPSSVRHCAPARGKTIGTPCARAVAIASRYAWPPYRWPPSAISSTRRRRSTGARPPAWSPCGCESTTRPPHECLAAARTARRFVRRCVRRASRHLAGRARGDRRHLPAAHGREASHDDGVCLADVEHRHSQPSVERARRRENESDRQRERGCGERPRAAAARASARPAPPHRTLRSPSRARASSEWTSPAGRRASSPPRASTRAASR